MTAAPPSVRRLLATVLVCEVIVLALAIPVAVAVQGVDGGTAALVCGGLAVACVVMAGLLRYRWSPAAGGLLQLLIIAAGFMVPAMFILGVLFAALWIVAIWLGHKAAAAHSR